MTENPARRLLIVDDNEVNLSAYMEFLGRDQSCAVEVTHNWQMAGVQMEKCSPDVILASLNTPGDADYEAIETLKHSNDFQNIPLLVVSCVTDPEIVSLLVRLGVDEYIHSALSTDPRVIEAHIQVCLERKRKHDIELAHLKKGEQMSHLLEEVILPVGIALSSETNYDRLLERILTEAKSICNADGGTLYMRTEDDHLRFAIVITDSQGVKMGGESGQPVNFPPLPLYNPETHEPYHQYIACNVALTGRTINIPDVYEDTTFDSTFRKAQDKANGYRTMSILTVPLKNNTGYVIGLIQLVNSTDPDGNIVPFDDGIVMVVESLCSQAAIVLNNHLLMEHQKLTAKLENDIQIGRNIQKNFLPTTMPTVPGWEIGARFQPAREVAGDFYDVFMMMNNKRVAFMLGDVCDKGVGAALFMSLIRSLIRAFARQNRNINWAENLFGEGTENAGRGSSRLAIAANALKTAVVSTNEYITEHHLDLNMFATLFIGMIDPSNGSLVYINGGHCPPLVIQPDGTVKQELDSTGPAVGMFPGSEFTIGETSLEPGDTLYIFSDGVTDARNPQGKRFLDEGLLALLKPPAENVNALLDRIASALQNHIADAVQFDDITMLSLRRE